MNSLKDPSKPPPSVVSHTSQESIDGSDAPAATPLSTLPGTPGARPAEHASKKPQKKSSKNKEKVAVVKKAKDVNKCKQKRPAKRKKGADHRSTDSGVELSSKPESSSAKAALKDSKKRKNETKANAKKREHALVCYDFESDSSAGGKKKGEDRGADSDSTVIEETPAKKRRASKVRVKSHKVVPGSVHEEAMSDSDETVIVSPDLILASVSTCSCASCLLFSDERRLLPRLECVANASTEHVAADDLAQEEATSESDVFAA